MNTLLERVQKYKASVDRARIEHIGGAIGIPHAEVYGVMEHKSRGGSHKDRAVAQMTLAKIAAGELTEGDTVVDYTTGSAGNSIAVLCREVGLRAKIIMPSNITEEREQMIRAAGADLILTPGDHILTPQEIAAGISEHQIWVRGAVARARQICTEEERHVLLNQSDNPNNPRAFHPLAMQILDYFKDLSPTHIITASGTSATAIGIAEVVRARLAPTQVVAVDCQKSASTWALKYARDFTHTPHKLFGTGPGAASPIARSGIELIDEVHCVNDEAAYDVCREVKKRGLSIGPTTGANILVARTILQDEISSRVVIICHDSADRYRSVGL